MADEPPHATINKRKKPDHTAEEIQAIIDSLIETARGKDKDQDDSVTTKSEETATVAAVIQLPRGAFKSVAAQFQTDPSTVGRLWRKALDNFSRTGTYTATANKKGRVGRRPVYRTNELLEAIQKLPDELRRSQRVLADALGVSAGTIGRLCQEHKGERILIPPSVVVLTDHNHSHNNQQEQQQEVTPPAAASSPKRQRRTNIRSRTKLPSSSMNAPQQEQVTVTAAAAAAATNTTSPEHISWDEALQSLANLEQWAVSNSMTMQDVDLLHQFRQRLNDHHLGQSF